MKIFQDRVDYSVTTEYASQAGWAGFSPSVSI